LEFNKFIEIVKIIRLKILKNVKIWWISMLERLKWIMANIRLWFWKSCKKTLQLFKQGRILTFSFFNIHTSLTLFYLLPLLEVVNALIKFAHLEEMFSFVILWQLLKNSKFLFSWCILILWLVTNVSIFKSFLCYGQ